MVRFRPLLAATLRMESSGSAASEVGAATVVVRLRPLQAAMALFVARVLTAHE